MSEILTPVVYELGLGAVGGFVVGFALKKIAKIFLIVIGIFVAALLYLGKNSQCEKTQAKKRGDPL